MNRVDDIARFDAAGDEALVDAALICPYCLGRPAHVLINNRADGGDAMCACARCELQWSVALDAQQALRLFLAPPQGLWIQHAFPRGE